MTSLSSVFYAGRYAEVLSRTVDSVDAKLDDDGVPFAIGALAFTGRLDEAESILRARALRGTALDADARAASRFYLVVGLARAGRHADAIALVVASFRERGAESDSLRRFYLHQGIACVRCFSGAMSRASNEASAALDAAVRASFPWGRLLASDLRGHALVQQGEVRAGLASLGHARSLAQRLGYEENVRVIDAASAVYRAKHGHDGAASYEALEALAANRPTSDGYTPRFVLVELVWQRALRGLRTLAEAALREIASDALQPQDRRARTYLLVAHAVVERLSRGLEPAKERIRAARALVSGSVDAELDVELTVAEALFGSTPEERPAVVARLATLAQATRSGRGLRVARLLSGGDPSEMERSVLGDDPLVFVLAEVALARPGAVTLAIDSGLHALVPLARSLAPRRRVHLLQGARMLLENYGEVSLVERVPAQAAELVRALASGPKTKEELVERLWGLKRYHAEKHDSVVYTAMSRLRAILSEGIDVDVEGGRYALGEGVDVVDDRAEVEGHEPAAAQVSPQEQRLAAIVEAAKVSPITSGDTARIHKVSEMTALRDLALLVERGLLVRVGKGRGTRYELALRATPE